MADPPAAIITWRTIDGPKPAAGVCPALRAKLPVSAALWTGSLEAPLRALLLRGEDVTAVAACCERALSAVRSRHSARLRLLDGAHLCGPGGGGGGGGGGAGGEGDEDAEERAGSLPPPSCCVLHVGVRRGGGAIRWESPLVVAQRAEAFVVAHPRGGWGGRRVLTWRVDPVAAQAWVAAAARGAAAAPAAAAALHYSVAGQLRAYGSLADALEAQRVRVAAGGEAWTRQEMLAKLSRLGTLRDRALVDAAREAERARAAGLGEPPLPLELMAVVEAWEAGNREIHGDAEEVEGGLVVLDGSGGGGGEIVDVIEEV
jgi:hypothetical protein